MAIISSIIFYGLIFSSVYIQVFFLITFLENRKKIIVRTGKTELETYPRVTIVVPCWNEETTIEKTVLSLLNLNYPKDKLNIFLVDDGSTDNTFEVLKKFTNYENISVFRKENGGKHTVLNFGLENSDSEFFGCLDADSYAHPDSLARIMTYFANDKDAMAVAPSVVVHNTTNVIQEAQKAEYHMGVYTKKMLGFLGAINVTPGPLTIFRKKVFEDLGPYRHAHNTEDMEIAYRMQRNGYKIEHCNDAYVYTNTPNTVKKLYRQRLRWIYGFINNTIDYRDVLFKSKYGNFALFTLPTGVISIIAICYLFVQIAYNLGYFIYSKVIFFNIAGFSPSFSTRFLDPFFFDTNLSGFLVLFIYSLAIFAILFGRKMIEGKWVFSINMLYFLIVFRILAPIWFLKALYNTLLSKKPNWR